MSRETALLACGVALSACHVGGPDERERSPLRVMATYPVADAGTDCDLTDPACGVERDVAIELRLNRFLRPDTAVRQSLRLSSGAQPLPLLEPDYDPIERVLTFRLPEEQALLPGTLYTVEVLQPDQQPAGWGLRAFDGAALEPGDVPLRFSFRTGQHVGQRESPAEAPVCDELAGVLERGGCGDAGCHQRPEPAMGLALTSVEDLIRESVGRVARQTETGVSVGRPLRNPARWGTQMPRVFAGEPASSYLMYKLFVRPDNFWPEGDARRACESRHRASTEGDCPVPSEQERKRLQSWFVRGAAMPLFDRAALHREDLELLQSWIRHGATCR